MQYLLIFLSVLVVLVGMNGFMFLTLRQMTRQIRDALEGRFIRELSVFDELYDKKVKRLEQLKEETERSNSNIFPQEPAKQREKPVVVTSSVPGGEIFVSRIVNPDFHEEYRYVKHAFEFDYEPLIGQVMELKKDPSWARGALADAILEKISGETALELSTLDGEEQLEVLAQVLGFEETEFIDQYRQEEGVELGDFSILECLSYLTSISRLYRDEVTVYTGTGNPTVSQPGIRVVYDPSICEGIRIVRGNRLYDYSY